MDQSNELRTWVDEAIYTLGYLKPEVAPKLYKLMTENPQSGHKQVATQYRKTGSQLSPEEKKALGIRANAVMTREALSDLTEKGLQNPLWAHEVTMRRANFAHDRVRGIARSQELGVKEWKISAAFPDECPGCKRLNNQTVGAEDISPTGPHDCFREACAISYSAKIKEFLDEILADQPEQKSRPWWKFW